MPELDVPGHTAGHIAYYASQVPGGAPLLFCGDTLFNAGAGNCHNGGDVGLLYTTFAEQLALSPKTVSVYRAHANRLKGVGL